MSLKPKPKKKNTQQRFTTSSLADIDQILHQRHQRISDKGEYHLRTGKLIPVSEDYKPNWILLKVQPKDSFHQKKMKNYLYHGTSTEHLDSIKKYGLMITDFPGMGAVSSSAWDGDARDMIGNVGLTDWFVNAISYSSHATILADKKGDQLILIVDKSKLNSEMLHIREDSGAPPAKEWDYGTEIPPNALVGYWANIGKINTNPDGTTYVVEGPKESHHKGWVYYANPRYRGDLD